MVRGAQKSHFGGMSCRHSAVVVSRSDRSTLTNRCFCSTGLTPLWCVCLALQEQQSTVYRPQWKPDCSQARDAKQALDSSRCNCRWLKAILLLSGSQTSNGLPQYRRGFFQMHITFSGKRHEDEDKLSKWIPTTSWMQPSCFGCILPVCSLDQFVFLCFIFLRHITL